MEFTEKLFGEDWAGAVVRSSDSQHPLARWYRKGPNNPVGRYVECLAEFILKSGMVKCNAARLASKLKAEFEETLSEMGYAVFLAKHGLVVTMEPFFPKQGSDLVAVGEHDYFVENRKVGLDEVRAAQDAATVELFDRLGKVPSRFGIVISMTDNFAAYSPELKTAAEKTTDALQRVTERNLKKASLYYFGPEDNMLIEGEVEEPNLAAHHADMGQLQLQVVLFERIQKAPFVARFDDDGAEKDHTPIAVHPLGSDPKILQPDKTHLRLRGILHKKREQLPKACRGIIVLELSELEKLGVDQWTVLAALYGDLKVTIRANPEGDVLKTDTDLSHRQNGFFKQTSRVSAVVIEKTKVTDKDVLVTREVFPTNNSAAVLLTRVELERFGTVVEDLAHLCRRE